ncbi:DUF4350 domain-containing protein [Natronococcus sp. A-GB1]|uniref:DUF4350 domain-containing protein n=1 Tax=Natronococcus sp. A-GB1 TaxID=3037648 RepID=UPI00241C9F2A|nr:DUF4350 domain-containing protein [Natronococcus sp. A-GB1]MDG5761814.1 DUF4350 domain-containing protein [Natronococcus sp. A-GB1]
MSADGDSDRARFGLVVFGVVVLVALAWAGATTSAAYDPYNPGDDGTSELRQQVESDPAVEYTSADGYDALEPEGTVAITVPSAADEADAATAAAFVRDGGTLVVTDESPEANAFLEAVGAEARLDGEVLRDERDYYRGPTMPVATGVEDHALTADVDRLGFSHATAIEPYGATVLATTSDATYLVDGPDATPGEDATPSAYPVATVEDVGDGTVVLVGDSAFATNELLENEDNVRFLANGYAEADRVAVVSSAADEPPLAALHSAVIDRLTSVL